MIRREVVYLGHVVRNGTLKPNPDKHQGYIRCFFAYNIARNQIIHNDG
jgi:hypothetical protein